MEQAGQIILTSFLILLGLAGSFLPILPGPPLAWAGLLVYGIFTDFQEATVLAIVIFGILTALTMVIDMLAPVLGAKGYKATRSGIIGALIGALIGVFVAGPIGIALGPLVGAFIGEYIAHRDHERALKAAWGAFVGFLVGSLIKVVVVLAMAAYFISILL